MTIDHLPPTRLQRLSHETFGYITSAIGFVLISGITAGWVYSKGPSIQWRRIFKRCGVICLFYFLLRSVTAIAPLGIHAPLRDVLRALIRLPGPVSGGDILLLYVVLMLPLPLLLILFKRGQGAWVLAASGGLWLLAQWRIGPMLGIGDVFAWQLVFVAGAWLGYRRQQGIPFPGLSSGRAVTALAICFGILFFFRHPFVRDPILDLGWVITSKAGVGAVRLLNLSVFAFLIAASPLAFAQKLASTKVCRPVSMLGRHSLQVFSWHALVVLVVSAFAAQWRAGGLIVQLPVAMAVLSSLLIPAWLHEQWRGWRKLATAPAAVHARQRKFAGMAPLPAADSMAHAPWMMATSASAAVSARSSSRHGETSSQPSAGMATHSR